MEGDDGYWCWLECVEEVPEEDETNEELLLITLLSEEKLCEGREKSFDESDNRSKEKS